MATRREFLKTIGAGVLGVSVAAQTDAVGMRKGRRVKKPNVLFICTDYQAWEDMHCENSFVDMPALDRLCREGATLTRHYSTAPICMPARYTWISGRYPHTHKEYDNSGKWLPEGIPTMMELLNDDGYHTVGVGKLHFHPWNNSGGLQRWVSACCKEAGGKKDDFSKYLRANGFDCNRIYKRDQGPDEWPRIYDYPEDEKFHIDHYVGDQATKIVEKDELNGPWFLWVSFNGPHSPWDAPAEYHELYKNKKMPKCRTYPWELNEKPANDTWERYVYSGAIMDFVDKHPEKREGLFEAMRRAHYANLTFIDRQVEKLFAALEKKGELDNTIIIWSADHGSCLGDHDMIHKATHYERSAHVPFVVRYPKGVKARRVDGFSGHVDLLPTILSMVGAPIPSELEGTDLSPMLKGDVDKVQDEVFIEIRNDTSIITDDWKLRVDAGPWFPSDYPIMTGDLYDLHADGDELKNLYDDPKYADVQKELIERIFKFNPLLKDKVKYPTPPRKEKPVEYRLVPGDAMNMHSEKEPPHLAGIALAIRAKLEPVEGKPMNGPLVLIRNRSHGLTTMVKDGKLAVGFRQWDDQDTIVVSKDRLPDGAVDVEVALAADGKLTLKVNGQVAGQGKAPGTIPVQTGRLCRATASNITVGTVGGRVWGPLLTKEDAKTKFQGTMSEVLLKIG
jgi:arylsulfatase